MSEISTFEELETLCKEAREHFSEHESEKKEEISYVFGLLIRMLRIISRFKTPEEWKESQEEDVLGVALQAVETLLAMYYLSESGFWDNALVLKRNYSELLITAIVIGYDPQCYIDWKHGRDCLDSFKKMCKRALESNDVPDTEKSLIPILKKYWSESSQFFSHNVSRKSIRTLVSSGQIKFEPKKATSDFQKARMNTIRNMLANIISILSGVFKFDLVVGTRQAEFSEGQNFVNELNGFFQKMSQNKEDTK